MPFCVYFRYNSNTTGYLQLCYTPKDSSTTRDVFIHVKSSKRLQPISLPCTYSLLILCTSTHDDKTQDAYNCTTHQMTYIVFTTKDASFRSTKWGRTYNFLFRTSFSFYVSMCFLSLYTAFPQIVKRLVIILDTYLVCMTTKQGHNRLCINLITGKLNGSVLEPHGSHPEKKQQKQRVKTFL